MMNPAINGLWPKLWLDYTEAIERQTQTKAHVIRRRFAGAVKKIKMRSDTKPKEAMTISHYLFVAILFTLNETQQQRQGSNAMLTTRP